MRLILLFLLLFAAPDLRAERPIPFTVTTQWLAEHLQDKDLVILQTGFSRNEFAYAHLPNARFLWFYALAPVTPDLNTEMPTRKEAVQALSDLGITDRSRIVLVFTGQNVAITTRMFLALSQFGYGERTSLLDGGLEAWKSEGREIAKGVLPVQRTAPKVTAAPSVITDAEWVKRHLRDTTVTIVDARAKNFFDGNGGGIARQGHIAGAKNLVFSSLLDSTSRLKPSGELQRLFDDAGIAKGTTVVSYCHVGQQATVVYFAAKVLGYDAKVYDGSFEDWNVRDESFPVEKK